MTATSVTIANILKTIYVKDAIAELAYKKSKLLGLVKKDTSMEGENWVVGNRYAGTGGGSANFTDAQANVFGASYGRFTNTPALDYSLARITTLAKRQSGSNKGALVRGIKSEVDAAYYTIARSMSRTMYGNGGGARGVVASGAGSTTLTLTDPDDIVGFEVGMVVSASATDGTSGTELDSNTQRLTAVDRDAGTITAAGNWDASDFQAGRFLFRHGDFGAMATGLDAWLPASAPGGSDSFKGFNRSVDTTRHAGIRYVATAATDGNIQGALVNASARALREAAMPDHVFMHPLDFAALVNELGAKRQYTDVSGRGMDGKSASFGWQALVLHSAAGQDLKILSDADCPRQVAYMLTLDTWCWRSYGDLPGFIDDDGSGEWLRVGNADAMEARIGYFGNIDCEAPGHNVRINLTQVL